MRKLIHVAIMLMPVAGVAQDLEAGLRAYNAGDYATALKEWRPLAERGNVSAQYKLGVLYSGGRGVPQDPVEAMKWFRLSADQGYAEAQFNLGSLYEKGEGVPQDYAEAAKWYRLAADQGDVWAQYILGSMYRKGDGVPQDDAEAAKWYSLAANQGHATARLELSNLLKWNTELAEKLKEERKTKVVLAIRDACIEKYHEDKFLALTAKACTDIFMVTGLPE